MKPCEAVSTDRGQAIQPMVELEFEQYVQGYDLDFDVQRA